MIIRVARAESISAREKRKKLLYILTQGHHSAFMDNLNKWRIAIDTQGHLFLRTACLYGQKKIIELILKYVRPPKTASFFSRGSYEELLRDCLQRVLTAQLDSGTDSLPARTIWDRERGPGSIRKKLRRALPYSLPASCANYYLDTVHILVKESKSQWHRGRPSWVVIDRAVRILLMPTMEGEFPSKADILLLLKGIQQLKNLTLETNITMAILIQTVCEAARDNSLIVEALLNVPGINPCACDNFVIRHADRYSLPVLSILLADGRIDSSARRSEALRVCVSHDLVGHIRLLLQTSSSISPMVAPTTISSRTGRFPSGEDAHAYTTANALTIALSRGNLHCIQPLVNDYRFLKDVHAVIQLLRWSTLQGSVALRGHIPFIKGLIRSGRLDPGMEQNALLAEACASGDLSLILFFIQHVDPGAFDQRVICSCSRYSEEVVRVLLTDKRVDPTFQSHLPLFNAVSDGALGPIKALLSDNRINPAVGNYYAIVLAARFGKVDVLQYLIETILPSKKGVWSSSTRQQVLQRALLEACHRRNCSCIDYIVSQTDVDAYPIADSVFKAAIGVERGAFPLSLIRSKVIDPSACDNLLLRRHIAHMRRDVLQELLLDPRVSAVRAPPGEPCALELANNLALEDLLRHPKTVNIDSFTIRRRSKFLIIRAQMRRLLQHSSRDVAISVGFMKQTRNYIPPEVSAYICTMAFGNAVFVRSLIPEQIMGNSLKLLLKVHRIPSGSELNKSKGCITSYYKLGSGVYHDYTPDDMLRMVASSKKNKTTKTQKSASRRKPSSQSSQDQCRKKLRAYTCALM